MTSTSERTRTAADPPASHELLPSGPPPPSAVRSDDLRFVSGSLEPFDTELDAMASRQAKCLDDADDVLRTLRALRDVWDVETGSLRASSDALIARSAAAEAMIAGAADQLAGLEAALAGLRHMAQANDDAIAEGKREGRSAIRLVQADLAATRAALRAQTELAVGSARADLEDSLRRQVEALREASAAEDQARHEARERWLDTREATLTTALARVRDELLHDLHATQRSQRRARHVAWGGAMLAIAALLVAVARLVG